MIAWLNTPALWGLLAIAGAVLVHLLFRQRVRRVPFPSLRFVRPSLTSAMRLRRPADLALLAVRAAILAATALALAQPLVMVPARSRAWDRRLARAVVVDSSESMRGAAAQADGVAVAELSGASASTRIDAADLGDGLRRASAWLEQAAPARREIVVISDLQQGALDDDAIAAAPPGAGLRFARVGTLPPAREFTAPATLDRDGVATARVRLEGAGTAVAIARGPRQPGLDLIAPPGDEAATQALRHVVAAAGTPAPSEREPVVVVFAGAAPPQPLQRPQKAWMLRAVTALTADEDLLAIGRSPAGATPSDPWLTVMEDGSGEALVRAAASGERLVIDVAARPSEFLAAAALRGVLAARADRRWTSEQEVLAIPAAALARWSRTPPPLDANRDAWRHAASDARWLWGLALVLLGVEAMMRRESQTRDEVRADAA